MALQIIAQRHRGLRRVTVHVDYLDIPGAGTSIRKILGEQICEQWLDLDHFLNKFWKSLSIHSNVVCIIPKGRHEIGDNVGYLLPEMKKREIIDLVEQSY